MFYLILKMLPSNKITNDRSSSPSVKALLNHYYHSNREKLKEKPTILQTVDDNSSEEIDEEDYHISSVRSSSKDSRDKKIEEDYLIQSFESSETHSSKKTDQYIINNYAKESVLKTKKSSKEDFGLEFYQKVTRPKSVPHQLLHDYTRSEYQNNQNLDKKKKNSSSPPLENEKSNDVSTTENNSSEFRGLDKTDSLNQTIMRSNESYDNSDEKIIRKAYSDCGPILQNNVLNNETHDLKLDLNSLKTLERVNIKPIRNSSSRLSNESANEVIDQLELDKIENNEKFKKNRETIQIKPTNIKAVQVDEYNLRKEERRFMENRKLAKKLEFSESLAERLVSSAIMAGSTENIIINCLLLPNYRF